MNRSASESFEGLIETAEGRTFVRTLGYGPPVVVIHGGPGFSHDYLLSVLRPISSRRRLVFFDQLGCGRTPAADQPLTLERCYAQLRSIWAHFADQGTVGAIAHSWGSLVVAGAMRQPPEAEQRLPVISEGLLINPMPVSSNAYEAARKRLIEKIPLSARLRAPLRALLTGNGAAVMRILLPFYMADPSRVPAEDFPLNLKTYRALDAELKDFDHSAGLADLENLMIVRGSHEFAAPQDIAALIAATADTRTIENAGHFPFWEQPEAFEDALQAAFA